MNLDEFISESLKGIFKGVKDAQDFAQESGGRINPTSYGNFVDAKRQTTRSNISDSNDTLTLLTDISFDIAVTASDKKESGASGGINVLSLKLGGKLEGERFNETVSRIKFSVTVALPSTIPYTKA